MLEDEANRAFLKKYLSARRNLFLLVIIGVKNLTVEIHSCEPPTYKPLDFTKLPKPDSPEWAEAITMLVENEEGHDVLWFDSVESAIFYIESNYPDSEDR